MTSKSEEFLNIKDIADLDKVSLYIKKLFTDYKTGGPNKYLYMCAGILVLVSPVCVCLYESYKIRVLTKAMSSMSNL